MPLSIGADRLPSTCTMKIVQSIIKPTKIGLSRRLQSHLGIKIPNASLKPGLAETSNLELVPDTLCHGRSFSASAKSNAVEVRKVRRRMSKDERKFVVERYVNNYRDTNGGKFPTTREAVKDVGGSFYVVRQIIQEMIHDSLHPSRDAKGSISKDKGYIKKDEISKPIANSEYISVSDNSEYGQIHTDNAIKLVEESELLMQDKSSCQTAKEMEKEVNKKQTAKKVIRNVVWEGQNSDAHAASSSGKDLGPQEEPKTSRYEENLKVEVQQSNEVSDKPEDIRSQSQSILHSDSESNVKKGEHRELHEDPMGVAEIERKTSVWQSLKSFASSFFGVWKR